MTLSDLETILSGASSPVILLEGKRSISDDLFRKARELGSLLAQRFVHARFRSGNAPGSDQAFTLGVTDIDPSRMEIVTPYQGHRKKHIPAGATCFYPHEDDPSMMASLVRDTVASSPGYDSLMKNRHKGRSLKAKSAYLLRDTLKVTGGQGLLDMPAVAIFIVDPADVTSGGTGHTIRVCQQYNVPFLFQDQWIPWLEGYEPVKFEE